MNAPTAGSVIELTRTTQTDRSELACCRCGDTMQADIIYGGLRYYVCRPCGQWAVPYPPIGYRPA
jgi:hypothetical protein